MALAWWAGWNNSFNKGYEQSGAGPVLGVLGMALFVATMFYVPMAQARQAATGRWKSFYQVNLIWRLIRCRPIANLILAACYAAAGGLVLISVVAVTFLPMIRPELDVMADASRLQCIESYYFRVCLFGFLIYAGLHILTARIYAGAVVKAIRTGVVSLDELNDDERELLGVLGHSGAAESQTGRPYPRLGRSDRPLDFSHRRRGTDGPHLARVHFQYIRRAILQLPLTTRLAQPTSGPPALVQPHPREAQEDRPGRLGLSVFDRFISVEESWGFERSLDETRKVPTDPDLFTRCEFAPRGPSRAYHDPRHSFRRRLGSG